VQEQTQDHVDQWWADLFGINADEVWHALTVQPHARLGDYEGYFVAWRADGVHVSLPDTTDDDVPRRLAKASLDVLQSTEFWQSFAGSVDARLIGPATHHYLDLDPGPDPDVSIVDAADVGALRRLVTDEEWEESGFGDDDVELVFGLHEDGRLVAAANLAGFAGAPRDVGVLVAPAARGRQLVDRVGRTAASHAIREHELARWVARTTNPGSVAAARRLGFEAWCTQLAIRA
jgi:hypothetical protein